MGDILKDVLNNIYSKIETIQIENVKDKSKDETENNRQDNTQYIKSNNESINDNNVNANIIANNSKYINSKYIKCVLDSGLIIDIRKENIRRINKKENIKNKKVCFVDGGSAEIIKAPNFSLFFNRIYYCIYKNNKRIENRLVEFYTLTYLEIKDKVFFNAENFFINNKIDIGNFKFNAFDNRISLGNRIADVSLFGNIMRRFCELAITKEIDTDYIVIDGSVEAIYPHEEEIIKKIKNKNILLGLSKTNNYVTSNNQSLIYYLSNFGDSFIFELGKIQERYVFFVKLNKKSDYIFKIELLDMGFEKKMVNEIIDDATYILSENSKDPVFLGYPYGLIEADLLARVTNREKEQIAAKAALLLGKSFEKIKKNMVAANAHNILDKIIF